jgi:hypothetical protein
MVSNFISILLNVLLIMAVIFVMVCAGMFAGYQLGRFKGAAKVMLVLTVLAGVFMFAPLVAPEALGSLTGLGILSLPFCYGAYRGVHLRATLGAQQSGPADESK